MEIEESWLLSTLPGMTEFALPEAELRFMKPGRMESGRRKKGWKHGVEELKLCACW